eukprot:5227579-Prymnesium_polylepis.2
MSEGRTDGPHTRLSLRLSGLAAGSRLKWPALTLLCRTLRRREQSGACAVVCAPTPPGSLGLALGPALAIVRRLR